MRILIIHPSFGVFGGAEDIVARLANYLDSKEHDVWIWTQFQGELKRYLRSQNIHIIPPDFRGYDMNNFDIINPHNNPAVLRSIYWKNKGVPIVWHFNEPSEHVLQGFPPTDQEANMARSVNRIIVWSEFNKVRTEELFRVTPKVVYLGIDYRFYNTRVQNAKKKLGLKDNYVILHPGWFNPYKNQMDSIDIFPEILKKIDNAKLVFTGYSKTPYASTCTKKIMKLDIDDSVIIDPFWSREKMRDYYYASDIVLMPYGHQGGFLSIFEAVVTGTPIILSTDSCASVEVESNKLGLVTNEYVDNILKIHDEPGSYWKLFKLKRSKKWIRTHVNWDMYCSTMLRIFEEEVEK